MKKKIKTFKKGLALSGGGFRATLYALGSLARMNENGLLTELDTITAVSGGAITAAHLMKRWSDLKFETIDATKNRYRATNFHEVIINPLLDFCSGTITSKRLILLATATPMTSAVNEVRKKYENLLFGKTLLRDIPNCDKAPEFIFYGTNLDTGVSVRISKDVIRDYHIGTAKNHDITLAQAVSISSGFPPFLSPVCLNGSAWEWEDSPYQKLLENKVQALRNKLALCDGGLYDNMGLEMLWKHGENREYDTVFSCDAGAPFSTPWKSPWKNNWPGKFARMSDIMINQQRALRKRVLVRNFIEKEHQGAYWSIENNLGKLISKEHHNDYANLKSLATQLKSFKGNDNHRLVNLGFCHADNALREWFDTSILASKYLPFNHLT